MPPAIDSLLSALDTALAKNACEPFKLEAGQFQYVNNWSVAHARAGFSDDTAASSGRHLVRLWNHSAVNTRAANEDSDRTQSESEPALAMS